MENLRKGKMAVFFFFFFFGLHPWHMEVPRIEVKLELQLPVYTTAIETRDPYRICDLHAAHGDTGSLIH